VTPEGRVKAEVKRLLKAAGAYWHCPVQNGMGAPALDFMHILHKGRVCAIETKAPGEKPTARQLLTISQIEAAGGTVFVIDGNYMELEKWLSQ
jgi:hypothetical protein